ncbi:GntR family transcriptional regulator [Kordiimonas pumila]|uniref:GntR family transcriptional regulator n=1 Tax=Kordiimonas pumila TaxID=2161677 RepID=A0ABV7D8C0_9PROT|nr:GntR family transcriptional regulator [Kordiimonas pumila]
MIHEIHTRPKSQALFENIRAKILEGHHPSGQWLKQADLESQYGASRSDVRSALSSLAERGVVEYVKNRGFRVFTRSTEELDEIAEMIAALETAAADSIIENATVQDMVETREIAKRFESLIRQGSQAELRIENYRFHDKIISMCGNKLIARTVRHLRECCASGPEVRYMTFDGLQKSNKEHFEIIEAIETDNAVALRNRLAAHAVQSEQG